MKNPLLFYQLTKINPSIAIQLGQGILHIRIAKATQLFKNNFKIRFQINDHILIGFAVHLEDASFTNEVGAMLAKFSLQSGFDNVGILILKIKDKKNSKVRILSQISLRGLNTQEVQVCSKIATYFNGGGHPSASSFIIQKNSLTKIIKNS